MKDYVKALRRLQDMNVTLHREKCKFARSQVPILGHIIDGDGIHADPEKVRAITDVPSTISDLRQEKISRRVNLL